MSEVHLSKSPIREAIVDFRFKYSEPVNLVELEKAHKKIEKDYPVKEVISMGSVMFNLKPGEKPRMEHSEGKVGYRFLNSTKDKIVQFRNDGFSFGKLKPYSSWDEVLAETQSLYPVYLKTVRAEQVTRLATRYINFIDTSAENINLKEYFNFYPNIPESIELPLGNFLTRLAFKNKETGLVSIVNQGFVEENIPDGTKAKSYLFDIDCYKENLSLDTKNPWDELQEIKVNTNKMFFEGINKATIESFK